MLYELREADFYEISRVSKALKPISAVRPDYVHEGRDGYKCDIPPKMEIDVDRCPIAGDDRDLYPKSKIEVNQHLIAGDDRDSEGRNRWEKAMIAFPLLNATITTTPILKHFDPDRSPVIVVYASK